MYLCSKVKSDRIVTLCLQVLCALLDFQGRSARDIPIGMDELQAYAPTLKTNAFRYFLAKVVRCTSHYFLCRAELILPAPDPGLWIYHLFSAFGFCAEIRMASNRDEIEANTSALVTSIKSAIHSHQHSSEMVLKRSSSSSSTGNGLQGGRTLAVCTMGVTLGPGVHLGLRFLWVASVLGFLLLPPATQICGKRVFGMT